jgi:hypothetical protein
MAGFRVDYVEGGFIIREIHPGNKDDRKMACGKTIDEIMPIIKRFCKHIKNKNHKDFRG